MPSMGLVFRGCDLAVEGDGDLRFADILHFYNFINYLYRTDRAQRWTNDLTARDADFDVTSSGGRARVESHSFDDRRLELHDRALETFKLRLCGTNLATTSLVRDARAFCVYKVSGSMGLSGWSELALSLSLALTACEGIRAVPALVLHVDQDLDHLHGIYLREPRARGNQFEKAMDAVSGSA